MPERLLRWPRGLPTVTPPKWSPDIRVAADPQAVTTDQEFMFFFEGTPTVNGKEPLKDSSRDTKRASKPVRTITCLRGIRHPWFVHFVKTPFYFRKINTPKQPQHFSHTRE